MAHATQGNRWRLQDALKTTAVEELVDRRIHRPIAFLLILPLQNRATFVTPTQITFVAMAAGVLALIPACVFFFLIQRYLVQGLTAGAVKG